MTYLRGARERTLLAPCQSKERISSPKKTSRDFPSHQVLIINRLCLVCNNSQQEVYTGRLSSKCWGKVTYYLAIARAQQVSTL